MSQERDPDYLLGLVRRLLQEAVILCHSPKCSRPATWHELPEGGCSIPTYCDEHKVLAEQRPSEYSDGYVEDPGAAVLREAEALLERHR